MQPPERLHLVTPGLHDNNVAAAWTAYLLREDDSPHTFLDHVLNGLAGGAAAGAGADMLNWLWRLRFPPRRLEAGAKIAWTRRGAAVGCSIECLAYIVHCLAPRRPPATNGSQPSDDQGGEMVVDPWAAKR